MPEESASAAPTDERLVAGTLDGDKECFGRLVECYWRMAVALALAKVKEPAAAEDIAQESFIRAYSNLGSLRDPSRFAGWLAGIVKQLVADHLRADARRNHVRLTEAAQSVPVTVNPGPAPDERDRIWNAVAQLPGQSQQVVIMRFVAGLTTKQIARQMSKRPGAIRVRLHRAYKALREALEDLGTEGHMP